MNINPDFLRRASVPTLNLPPTPTNSSFNFARNSHLSSHNHSPASSRNSSPSRKSSNAGLPAAAAAAADQQSSNLNPYKYVPKMGMSNVHVPVENGGTPSAAAGSGPLNDFFGKWSFSRRPSTAGAVAVLPSTPENESAPFPKLQPAPPPKKVQRSRTGVIKTKND